MIYTGSKLHGKFCSKPLWQVHLDSHTFDRSHTHLYWLHLCRDLFWGSVPVLSLYLAHEMVCLFPPLCCKSAADLGSKGTLGSRGLGVVAEGAFLPRGLFSWKRVVQAMGETGGHLLVVLSHKVLLELIQVEL